MGGSIQERLQEFYRRLKSAPPVSTADEALAQLVRILDEVEDELSGVPKQFPPPSLNKFDGRMYPPLPDHVDRTAEGGIHARTRGHVIDIGPNGRIVIKRKRTGTIEFEK